MIHHFRFGKKVLNFKASEIASWPCIALSFSSSDVSVMSDFFYSLDDFSPSCNMLNLCVSHLYEVQPEQRVRKVCEDHTRLIYILIFISTTKTWRAKLCPNRILFIRMWKIGEKYSDVSALLCHYRNTSNSLRNNFFFYISFFLVDFLSWQGFNIHLLSLWRWTIDAKLFGKWSLLLLNHRQKILEGKKNISESGLL